ncbi:MAG: endopeptidase La [Desulfuromonadales bacterium]|nr:endopeptidase La [Desulfuromonadales bacterium]
MNEQIMSLPIYFMHEHVVFPNMVFPLFVNADKLAVVEEAVQREHLIGLVLCRAGEDCRFSDLAAIGTLCRIRQMLRIPGGGAKVIIEGQQRLRLIEPLQEGPWLLARVEILPDPSSDSLVAEALVQSVNALLKIALAYGRPLPGDVLKMIDQIEEPGRLADLVTVYLSLDLAAQQRVLEILDPVERLKEVYLHLTGEVQKMQVRGEVQSEVAKRMGRTQKEYILREQLKQIQQELGEDDNPKSDLDDLRQAVEQAEMPEQVREVADKELNRLTRINPASPEHTVARTYIDYLCSVPWSRSSEDNLDIAHAQSVLDEDHYGLDKIKERILEYLAVRSLKADTKGPILCFVGPPGVGKTSLGRSIARATGRPFIRISLGGMKDEAEIRGHRRTYIGALPGRIIREICRAGANNPVFMLDEVDKIGQDFRGDPASALLEVLDPEQNDSFTDHYLDVPFDLSRVMFIATANVLDPIPPPLRDRMEVISLPGYSEEEKLAIARRYLVDKQQHENGLDGQLLDLPAATLQRLIRNYTREAGVRSLERHIASLCRKVAKQIAQGDQPHLVVAAEDLETLLGPRRFFTDVADEQDRVGVVTGLAWTEAGGDIIFIEASRMAGQGGLTLTGSLGEVMQESARAALSLVRANAARFGIDSQAFASQDIHIHVPSGAIPKDGPSAGVAMAIALISLFTDSAVRRDVAMTGELTLSGRILPVGGIKEKVLAARRAGVTCILLPEKNREHLVDIEPELREGLRIECVADLETIVRLALLPATPVAPPQPDPAVPAMPTGFDVPSTATDLSGGWQPGAERR